ncbi:hypothetical protein LXA43DRAFT_887036 [Ganoderma leucocontextum]|nr:hypothetical protein LXA43DRAFT_887036 [Ganoderma leucocontextum]
MDAVGDHEPSTSASTIRGFRPLDMAARSESAPAHDDHHDSHSPFRPSTPHSAFQSEPGSPSGDSVSSFPSVGSSFLFSSGPTSPPHPAHHPEAEDGDELGDSTSGLVIPSLTLPSPSRHPTVYGKTLGDVRLLLLGPRGADMSVVASQLVDDNEDVVEVGLWEEDRYEGVSARGKTKAVLHVSTDWVEHRDRHGLEHVEPARNVEIVELPPYDSHSEVQSVVERVLPVIHYPFREVLDILNHDHPPSGTLAHLLSSTCSPLYTVLIILATPCKSNCHFLNQTIHPFPPAALSPVERALVESLSTHIPIVLHPPSVSLSSGVSSHDHTRRASSSHLSAFRPTSIAALRTGLFRNPTTLATLRAEAAARFLRWREVERAVERVRWSAETYHVDGERHPNAKAEWFDKQAWEAQWDPQDSLSREVALHLQRRSEPPRHASPFLITPPCNTAFDPLHLPSLVVFSFSLLGALRTRVARSLGYTFGLGIALVSAFCAGVGIGLVAVTRF